MEDKYYRNKIEQGLIFTEGHLVRGGRPICMREASGTISHQCFRVGKTKQWSREKRRYLTFDEWERQQQTVEAYNTMTSYAIGRINYDAGI